MSTSNEKNGNFKFDDFIAKIVPDPAKPSGHNVLSGFIGASSEKDHIRVYFDESLNYFIDIPEASVVYTKPLSDSPHGGSSIWVKADTEYTFGDPSSEKRGKKKFFEGPVYQEYITSYCQPVQTGGAAATINCHHAHQPIATLMLCGVARPQKETGYQRVNQESISFQYCPTERCPTKIVDCSLLCPSFQYCPNPHGGGGGIREQIERGNPQVNPESISFQYCPTERCPTKIVDCSLLCPSFQYCPNPHGGGGGIREQVERGYPQFNQEPVSYQYCPTKIDCTWSCPTFPHCTDQRGGGGGINEQIERQESISFQYCPTERCPTKIVDCSLLCPSFQYCPNPHGGGGGIREQIERGNPQANPESMSFHYCPTLIDCTWSCPTFRACPPPHGGGTREQIERGYPQANQNIGREGYRRGFNPYRGY